MPARSRSSFNFFSNDILSRILLDGIVSMILLYSLPTKPQEGATMAAAKVVKRKMTLGEEIEQRRVRNAAEMRIAEDEVFPDAARGLYATVLHQMDWHVKEIASEFQRHDHVEALPNLVEIEKDARAILAYAQLLQRVAE